jgi:hypothetical protein
MQFLKTTGRLAALSKMLSEFDQNTLANMTAAPEYVRNRIPPGKDSHELRKRLGDAMIQLANGGERSLVGFQNESLRALAEALRPPRSKWFAWLFR